MVKVRRIEISQLLAHLLDEAVHSPQNARQKQEKLYCPHIYSFNFIVRAFVH